jgi:TetR/AcrR family transcriptional regulator, transcriptional repressor for nem operon
MNEAGLTAGGFYAHFASKEALFAEAMTVALNPDKGPRATTSSTLGAIDPLGGLIKGYLSRTHRDSVSNGCPLPALTSDVARKSDATRESYERQFLRFLNKIEELLPEDSTSSREQALAIIAQCVGGLMLSRAVKNEKLSDQILRSCRMAAMKIREDQAANE